MEQDRKDLKWVVLCRRANCCPSVAVDGGMLHIKDDDGQQVKITLDQFDDIAQAVKDLREGRDV